MLISLEQCTQHHGKPFEGILHIGTGVGSEGKDYSDFGARRVVWFESDKYSMKSLYDKTVPLPMKSEYVNETFGLQRRFDAFYKENQVHLNIYDFDFVYIDSTDTLEVLSGFGNMFDRFQNLKAVHCQCNEDTDALLMKFGFHRILTRMTEHRTDAFYLRT